MLNGQINVRFSGISGAGSCRAISVRGTVRSLWSTLHFYCSVSCGGECVSLGWGRGREKAVAVAAVGDWILIVCRMCDIKKMTRLISEHRCWCSTSFSPFSWKIHSCKMSERVQLRPPRVHSHWGWCTVPSCGIQLLVHSSARSRERRWTSVRRISFSPISMEPTNWSEENLLFEFKCLM